MSLPAVDMDSCCKKQRCLSGVNVGKVYDTCSPCQGIGEFDVELCDCISVAGIYEIGIESYGRLGLRASATFLVDIPEPYFDEDGALIQKFVGRVRSANPPNSIWSEFDPSGTEDAIFYCENTNFAYLAETFVAPGLTATLADWICDLNPDYRASTADEGKLLIGWLKDGCFYSYDIIFGGSIQADCSTMRTIYHNGKLRYLGRGVIDSACCQTTNCSIGDFSTEAGACFIPEPS